MEGDVGDAVRGGTWIFLSNACVSLIGFAFWFVITRLVGVEATGIVSSLISAAGIAATLVCAGLNIAVMREVAGGGAEALGACLALAGICGIAASGLSIPLTLAIGYREYIWLAAAFALLTIIASTLTSALAGFERFRGFFAATASGSVARLITGCLLAILGFGVSAAILGYLIGAAVSATAACLLLAPYLRRASLTKRKLVDLFKLAYANYPYAFSAQLIVSLGVYIFAWLAGEAFQTGMLYLCLMIFLITSSVARSILSAALPIGVRHNIDPFAEGLRTGLALLTPAVALLSFAADDILRLLNPELAGGGHLLRILMFAAAPAVLVDAAVFKLNKEKREKDILLIGSLRLITLVALLLIMVRCWGVLGAGAAFVAANIAACAPALRYIGRAREFLELWLIQAILVGASLRIGGIPIGIGGAALCLIVMHLARIFKIDELLSVARLVLRELALRS